MASGDITTALDLGNENKQKIRLLQVFDSIRLPQVLEFFLVRKYFMDKDSQNCYVYQSLYKLLTVSKADVNRAPKLIYFCGSKLALEFNNFV